jgi:hypothetical protein
MKIKSTGLILLFPVLVNAGSFYVSPIGSNNNSGTSSNPFETIQYAIDFASDGDYIKLKTGIYNESLVIDKPLKIESTYYRREKDSYGKTGDSIICGQTSQSRVIQVFSSGVELRGITVDGDCHGDKRGDIGIFVGSQDVQTYISGIKIKYSSVRNMRGECVRMKYFVKDSEISMNSISGCGTDAFYHIPSGSSKNGEGIYIGTSHKIEQRNKNPDTTIDDTNNISIVNNLINTQGNECVDVKEGSNNIRIESNYCLGQREQHAACYRMSGTSSIIKNNKCFGAVGSGVLITTSHNGTDYAKNNTVRSNKVTRVGEYGIEDHGNGGNTYCGNTVSNPQIEISNLTIDVTASCN